MKIPLEKFRKMKPLHKAVSLLSIVALAYALFGFLVAPLILKIALEKKLPQILNRQVSIDNIRMNPFSLSATVERFRLAGKEGAGEFVSFDRLYVNFEGLSIFKRALIIRSVSLTGPSLEFSRLDDRTFSFSDLLDSGEKDGPEQGQRGRALFSINNIDITGGTIRYRDVPKGANHLVEDLTLRIPSISNLPSHIESFVQPVFSAVINDTPISLAGGSKPFAESRATEMDLRMNGIDIPKYLAYIPNPTGLTVKSAMLDVDARLIFRHLPDQASRLSLTGTVALRDLDLTDLEGHSYLKLPSVTAVLADSDLLAREVRLTELTIEAPQLEMTRLGGGDLLPLSLFSPAESDPEGIPGQAAETAASPANPLRMTIDRIRLGKGAVSFNDGALKSPATVRIEPIDLTVENLSTIPDTPGSIDFSLRVNQTGRLSGKGTFTVEPPALKSSLEIEDLKLPDIQPYVAEYARVLLTEGTFSLEGELEVKPEATGSSGLFFAGHCSIADLSTIDTLTGDDLLRWKVLQVGKIVYSGSPRELSIEGIRLEDPYAGVTIDDNGTLNLSILFEPDPRSDAPRPGDSETGTGSSVERKINIGRIAIHNGKVRFLDRSIKPAYGTELGQLNATITGLSSRPDILASLRMDARLDQQAPLSITGEINPLSTKPFANISVDFKNFNLSPLSPYSGKFVGNRIEKGKLNFDLNYQIRENLLESSNLVFLDQFTLGEAVESPDATSLPVDLAVALLKNRKGEIFLDIPVRGDLNDPEFSIGRVVIQVLVNLISKAATSPLALLGSLIPEGQDLQHVFFQPGLTELTTPEAEKLALVEKVLHERPGLRMDILGSADLRLDRQALARAHLLKLVQLEKLRETGTSPKIEETAYRKVVLSAEEYPRYLENVYRKALKDSPESDKAAVSQIKPANEAEAVARMEKFLLSGIRINDEDLRLLALERANTILAKLVESGRIEAGRLFVIEPRLVSPEGEGEPAAQTLAELVIK